MPFLTQLTSILAQANQSWGVLEASWSVLGASWPRLGPSWAPLGASWARLGASWWRLGRVLGRLGRVLGRKTTPKINLIRHGTGSAVSVVVSLCSVLFFSISFRFFLYLFASFPRVYAPLASLATLARSLRSSND